MIVVVGGAYQGKTAYVRKRFPELSFLPAGECDREELGKAQGILNLQDYLYRLLREEKEGTNAASFQSDPKEPLFLEVPLLSEELAALLEELCSLPGRVITLQEVGCGVVPLDPFERSYRELVGRFGTLLCQRSQEVVRICFGTEQVIKKEGRTPKKGGTL